MNRLKLFLRSLWPRYWLRNYETNGMLSCKINTLIDKGTPFTDIDQYTASLGPLRLWIANYPYAFCCYGSVMPDRKTVIRAHDWLMVCVGKEISDA